MPEEILNHISAKCSVIIIGAGQAGLSIAHSLQKKRDKTSNLRKKLCWVFLERTTLGFFLPCDPKLAMHTS